MGAVAMLLAVGPTRAAVPGCSKTGFTAEGYDTDQQGKALGAAIFAWTKRVAASSLGDRFADWNRAQQKSVDCRKTGIYYTCTISAQPCP
ncbi:hypothetical protein [Bradyrhizobium sp. WD16]|uniref:hypothetical protein n=1 Tax=Bradyrhizobium sp. WD16 TaxID=1521768 RepID=UPI0020A35FF8|nr:hypothetical protein [Bradyrhizobium sp. WD16]UTD26574.1 hypothetical protein DB459_06195 [Bradyrhizobium sp. WD16]